MILGLIKSSIKPLTLRIGRGSPAFIKSKLNFCMVTSLLALRTALLSRANLTPNDQGAFLSFTPGPSPLSRAASKRASRRPQGRQACTWNIGSCGARRSRIACTSAGSRPACRAGKLWKATAQAQRFGDRVGQKQGLDFGFGQGSAMHALEQRNEDVGQNRRIGDDAGDVRHHAEGLLQLAERRPEC